MRGKQLYLILILCIAALFSLVSSTNRCGPRKYSLEYILLSSDYSSELRSYCKFDTLTSNKIKIASNAFFNYPCLSKDFFDTYAIIDFDSNNIWKQDLIEIRVFNTGNKSAKIGIKNYWCNFYLITEFKLSNRKWIIVESEIIEI